ncbi:hypothetical protein QBC46DRAFT_79212 [Diplogelasinospora grovesii]|uniref:Uncharacterized protein n=1 Tax=Diplogelasinospora grovesii TaxID=303347 RepID=A0AAN6RZ39_9PEZI|nr:hypothetical protein QBC46DRAFT_79212 [Diplogelasinospora grovesii]
MAVLEPRLEDRQGAVVVTQLITRPYTTITALVTLGGGPTPDPSTLPTVAATTTSPVDNAPTAPIVETTPTSSGSSSLNQDQIGAILGSVVAFVVLVLIAWYCLSMRRRRRIAAMYDESEGSTVEVQYYEVHPGGDPWNRPGHGTGPRIVPPPPRFPPTPRYTYTQYRQTRQPQIPGVRRYP